MEFTPRNRIDRTAIMAFVQHVDAADMVRQVQAQLDEFYHLNLQEKSEEELFNRVPPSMQLQPSMKQAIQSHTLSDALFLPIHFTTSERDNAPLTMMVQPPERGRTVVQRHLGSVGAMVWVIRRSGCSFCRHLAGTLTALANRCPEYFSTTEPNGQPLFQLFGIVKDTCDEASVVEYHNDYFPFPLYVDPSMSCYQALGDRKLSLSQILTTKEAWKNILYQTYQSYRTKSSSASQEVRKVAVASEEVMLLGGLILWDRHGQPVAMYPEKTELPLGDILQTMRAMRVLPESAS
jgi:AhpC/TSA antioxidant enzyme